MTAAKRAPGGRESGACATPERIVWGRRKSLLALSALTLMLGACHDARQARLSGEAGTVSAFLRDYWTRPLMAQGPAPAGFSALESSLAPASCGACHASQYRDWKTSRHAQAFGPGLLGQMQALQARDHAGHQNCLRCHAPLAEQEQSLSDALWIQNEAPNKHPVRGASWHDGLSCAACHVRGNLRYGPPAPALDLAWSRVSPPHAGWVTSTAFRRSQFCAACHQFPNSAPKLDGKPLENTDVEWQTSPFARRGVSCQACHMPDGKHLWRGIHDLAMVRSGLRFDIRAPAQANDQIRAGLTVISAHVGHDFPTYVTPRVLVTLTQLDARGRAIRSTLQQGVIARDVSLDLQRQRFDTRIPPGGTFAMQYRARRSPQARWLRYTVTVDPDYFYARLDRSWLRDPQFGAGRGALRAALRHAENASYDLLNFKLPLQSPPSSVARR